MEKLVSWAKAHKALAIGLGIGVAVLIYLLFFRGSSNAAANAAASGNAALGSYYGAEAASIQAGAMNQGSLDALNASNNQTNASAQVATTYISALKDMFTASQVTQLANINAGETVSTAQINAQATTATNLASIGLEQDIYDKAIAAQTLLYGQSAGGTPGAAVSSIPGFNAPPGLIQGGFQPNANGTLNFSVEAVPNGGMPFGGLFVQPKAAA